MVKDLPSSARLAGSIPGQGTKIPRMVGQLNPLALQPEKLTTTRESPHAAMKAQCNQNKKERIQTVAS